MPHRIYYAVSHLKQRRNAFMEPRETHGDVDDLIYCDDWFPSDR